MLPLKFETVSPYLRDKVRLFALHNNNHYGSNDIYDEHVMHKLDTYVTNLENQKLYGLYEGLKQVDMPDIKRERMNNNVIPSDVLLRDTSRQHFGIEEKFRRGQTNIHDLYRIYEPSYKYHYSIAGPFERHLINSMNRYNSEMVLRRSIAI